MPQGEGVRPEDFDSEGPITTDAEGKIVRGGTVEGDASEETTNDFTVTSVHPDEKAAREFFHPEEEKSGQK